MIGCRCKAAMEMSLSLFVSLLDPHVTGWLRCTHYIMSAVADAKCRGGGLQASAGVSVSHIHTHARTTVLPQSWCEWRRGKVLSVIRAQQRVRHDCRTTLTASEWEPRREWPTDCYYYFNKQMSLDTPRSKQTEWGWTLAMGLGTSCKEKLLAQCSGFSASFRIFIT